MIWGLFKKVVIADRLAVGIGTVYGDPRAFTGLPLILATVLFAFQIYCDFSGYSDIAIGAAQVMGFRLMDNFNRPYFSKSIAEFWKRWHISLSTWFRDYLYIPLGGNRAKTWRWQYNLFVTFLVSGFWHGANWTYIIWGALNGFYLLSSIWTRKLRYAVCRLTTLDTHPTLHKYVKVTITFSLICVAWIFFRARNFNDAWYVLTHVPQGVVMQVLHHRENAYKFDIGMSHADLVVAFVAIAMMECLHAIQRHRGIRHMLAERPIWMRWTVYYALVLGIVFFGVFEKRSFIYFQF
jgi:D-alanyl-lipoteichoic acid acyltransferase DltB (MBOAT superfamily)